MKTFFAIIFLFLTSNIQATEMLEELGLAWGQTQKSLSAKKYTLTNCLTNKKITACDVTQHVEGIAHDMMYILFFEANDGLQKLQMPIRYIEDDPTGEKGIDLYAQLKEAMKEKYGEPKSYEYVGKKLYTGAKEFYQCLQYKGCGTWSSFWSLPNDDFAYISLIGAEKESAYLVLFYESKRWQEIVDTM